VGDFVRLESEGGIGTIRLDRPPMNALNTQIQEELRAVAHAAAADADIRAVVVYGGEKVFAAGADITEFTTMTYQEMTLRAAALSSAFDAIAKIGKPVVAAVTGYALGGGCELALACDWRVVATDARLGQPEIKLGLIPGAGGTQRLARLIGPARAKDLVFSGRMVDADEALRIGLVNRVYPTEELAARAEEALVAMATGPTLALAGTKALLRSNVDRDLDQALAAEAQGQAAAGRTKDHLEGVRAFLDKRPPEFLGA
jgi:enoyl-CoA hydratase/carnithine racemase